MVIGTCSTVVMVIFGIWNQFLGTLCRYYMVIFRIWHQFLGTPCRYNIVIFGIWHQFLGTSCRYYMIIFVIWHQVLGTPCRYYMVIFGIWHQFLGTPVIIKVSERSEWPVGIGGDLGGTGQAALYEAKLLPAGRTKQAQTFRMSSGHMADSHPINGFLRNSNMKNFC